MKPTMLFVSVEPIQYRRRVLNEIETAKNCGFDIMVISTSETKLIKQKYNFKYIAIIIPGFLKWGIFAFPVFNFLLFFKIILKKFDAIHFRGIIPIPAILVRQWFNKSKLIYDAHEYYRGHLIFKHRPIRKAVWMYFEKQIVRYVKTIITVCEPLAELLGNDYPVVESVYVIRNVPNLIKTIPREFTKSENKRVIVFHGYFLPGRALEQIIAAMAEIKDDSISLMLIGEGILKDKLERLTNELDLHHKIQFHSFVPNEQLIEFIKEAEIGLTIIEPDCTNRKYALPNKFFEYIHAGLPVLASNIPTLQMYVDSYQVGQTVEPYDIESIANAIISMMANKEKLRFWRDNCLKAALELNWENEKKKLEKIYKSLMAS